MKAKHLIRPESMQAMISAARKLHKAGKPVYVTSLLKNYYGGNHRSSSQRRRLVAAELDKAGISRVKRIQTTSFQEFLVKTTQKPGKFEFSENSLEDASQPSESIPGTLGGIAADDSDVIDVSFTLGDELTTDMDEFLAEEVRNGNRRALRLLKSQIRRG